MKLKGVQMALRNVLQWFYFQVKLLEASPTAFLQAGEDILPFLF